MTQLRSGEDINESITNQSQPDRVYIDLTVEDAILYALSGNLVGFFQHFKVFFCHSLS